MRVAADGLDQDLRQVCTWGRRLFDRGLVSSTGGNISCRTGDSVLISAYGSCLGDLDTASVVRVQLDGKPPGNGQPSRELPVHLTIHQRCPDMRGVAVYPTISCGECYACRAGRENICINSQTIGYEIDGGFAEHVIVPAAAVSRGNVPS